MDNPWLIGSIKVSIPDELRLYEDHFFAFKNDYDRKEEI